MNGSTNGYEGKFLNSLTRYMSGAFLGVFEDLATGLRLFSFRFLLLTDGDMPSRFTIFISEFLLEREGDPFDDLECLVTGVPSFGRL